MAVIIPYFRPANSAKTAKGQDRLGTAKILLLALGLALAIGLVGRIMGWDQRTFFAAALIVRLLGLIPVIGSMLAEARPRGVSKPTEITPDELRRALEAELGPEFVAAAQRFNGKPDPSSVTDEDLADFDELEPEGNEHAG